jgi:hypothetical protein
MYLLCGEQKNTKLAFMEIKKASKTSYTKLLNEQIHTCLYKMCLSNKRTYENPKDAQKGVLPKNVFNDQAWAFSDF